MKALEQQIGGTHYQGYDIQPAEFMARKYPWAEIRGSRGGLLDGICDALCVAEYGLQAEGER